MPVARVMTYSVGGSRVGVKTRDPDAILKVIDAAAPDLVALQGVEPEEASLFADALGLTLYVPPSSRGNVVLTSLPCKGMQDVDLGFGGSCLKLDVELAEKRFHFFNVFVATSWKAPHQIGRLISPEVLAHRSVVCPTIVAGNFSSFPWMGAALGLSLSFRKIPSPIFSGTYPARFPLLSSERAYVRGDIRIIDSRIIRSCAARHAASSLPLVMTLRIEDPRSYLKLRKFRQNRMEIAPG